MRRVACAARSTRSIARRCGPSALCLVAIALLVGAQLAGRLLDGTLALLHLPRTDFVILSLDEICGYLLAGASFLALAGTLKAGAHIRVTMVLGLLGERARRFVEIWAFGFAAAAAGYMTWQLANFAWVSFRFHEVSTGVMRVPLAYPQAVMALGALILTVALLDELVIVICARPPELPRRRGRHHLGQGRRARAMSVVELSLVLMLLLFAVLGSGVWIALALGVCGFAAILTKASTPAGQVLATSMWAASDSWDLTALPMFIWMGEILYRTKLSDDMFEGLAPWVQKLPGRLLHVNVIGCAIFAAVSGSSAATCATIGRIALPELLKRGYDEKMAIGTLAGSGTLGLLIPPSIIMIVYATATDQSIARLFIAGVIPGIMLAVLFMGFIVGLGAAQREPHAAARAVRAVPRAHQRLAPADPGDAADPRRHRLDLWRAGLGHGSGGGRRVSLARRCRGGRAR